jgi:hypothetical protein
MTMQIAMVGTDGVVLASDTKWSERHIRPHLKRLIQQSFGRSKIMINYERRIAVSFARNMESSARAAANIIQEIRDEEWDNPKQRIEAIAIKAMNSLSYNIRDVNCLIVSPALRLFRLDMQTDLSKGPDSMPECWEQTDRACAGDDINPAVFWAERYYRRMPLRKLVPLAAHLICEAGELSPDRVKGLEIILCKKSGIRHLSIDSVRDLQSWAHRLDARLRMSFTSHAPPFTYARGVKA